MTGCKLVSHMVHEGPPYYATGAMKALHHCQTHNMSVQDGEQLCPIGKVEKAVDDGLGRISTALETDAEYRKSELRIQALGAAISRRDWHAVEQAFASIRDKFHSHSAPR